MHIVDLRLTAKLDVILLHYFSTQLILIEMYLDSPTRVNDHLKLQRQKYLHASVAAIKSWFGVDMSISAAEYTGISFLTGTQPVRCVGRLLFLATLDNEPGWDKDYVRTEMHPLTALDSMAARLEQIAALVPEDEDDEKSPFHRQLNMFKTLRPVWAARLEGKEVVENANGATNAIPDGFADNLDFNLLDGDWIFDYPMFEAPGHNGMAGDPNIPVAI